jgi:hypothetical protein
MRTAAIPVTRKPTYQASSKRSALKRLLAGIRAPANDRCARYERLDFGSSVREASRNTDATTRKGRKGAL